MRRRILDTCVLIGHWRRKQSRLRPTSQADVAAWADELVQLYDTNAIVTPVRLEFLAGTRSRDELVLAEAYLGQFHVIDNGDVVKDDWLAAERIARRAPRDGKARDLGDCLIRAIAERLRYEVRTSDTAFPKRP